ncbi:unnamed protein product [Hermetia illucens]|uniref:Uncharacterized protein n=1 Tax=Hermetia illucens TaxID=343691 RepID=A0A7R8UJH3_HERIL|nr:gram-negative bacteria-binding protein 3-like [Hermetia illucens]CAD7082007.1 unnamed protein product [Hermetia illucens]
MTFNGQLNSELDGVEIGMWFDDDVRPNNGQLIFKNSTSNLRIGDVIYYRISVTSSGQTKQYEDGVYVVAGYNNKVGSTNIWHAPSMDTTSAECKPSITVVNGVQQKCAERLIFSETFSGNRLDTSKWTPQERFAGQPDYEFVTYLKREDVVYVNQGHLFIEPKRMTDFYGQSIFNFNLTLNLHPDCTGELDTNDCIRRNSVDIVPPIASGQITTKGYFSFLYGSVQIRAKLPDIPWSFLQFFLEPTENAYGNYNLNSGQMRVAFVTGIDTCILSGGVISNGDKTSRNDHICEKPCNNNRKWSSDFHIYSLKWTPNSITVSVDGKQYCEIGPMKEPYFTGIDGELIPTLTLLRPTTEMAPFDHPFHLTIGLGIGGHTEFSDELPNKPWSNLDPRSMRKFWKDVKQKTYPRGRLEVDYIQVFTV